MVANDPIFESWMEAEWADASETPRAARANVRYAERLGWGRRLAAVSRLLGTTAGVGTTDFASAVARWQRAQKLAADGVLGPASWRRMQKALGPPPLPAVDWRTFTPTPVERVGGRRIQDRSEPAPSDVVYVDGVGGRRVPLHRLAARAWAALANKARADGLPEPLLRPVSGYRSVAHQKRLWERALARYGSVKRARQYVAVPGGSAHHSGRAIDLYLGGLNDSSRIPQLRTLPAYKWMVAHAERFGFYPYPTEPWHWEYNPPARSGREREWLEV